MMPGPGQGVVKPLNAMIAANRARGIATVTAELDRPLFEIIFPAQDTLNQKSGVEGKEWTVLQVLPMTYAPVGKIVAAPSSGELALRVISIVFVLRDAVPFVEEEGRSPV